MTGSIFFTLQQTQAVDVPVYVMPTAGTVERLQYQCTSPDSHPGIFEGLPEGLFIAKITRGRYVRLNPGDKIRKNALLYLVREVNPVIIRVEFK